MPPSIRVSPGDWGDVGPLENVETVASSAADSLLPGFVGAIELRAVGGDAPPRALNRLSAAGEYVVELNIHGPVWARLAYQFAHEFCHVLAEATTFEWDRFSWFEEALCETASLFALRRMAQSWAASPPFPYWHDYAPHLASYANHRIADAAHKLPAGEALATWLANALPTLETDLGRRDEQAIVANELLPIFEALPGAWHAVRSLHDAPRPDQGSIEEHLAGWARVAPAAHRHVIRRIEGALL